MKPIRQHALDVSAANATKPDPDHPFNSAALDPDLVKNPATTIPKGFATGVAANPGATAPEPKVITNGNTQAAAQTPDMQGYDSAAAGQTQQKFTGNRTWNSEPGAMLNTVKIDPKYYNAGQKAGTESRVGMLTNGPAQPGTAPILSAQRIPAKYQAGDQQQQQGGAQFATVTNGQGKPLAATGRIIDKDGKDRTADFMQPPAQKPGQQGRY
jgi:hypothetical protein